MSPGLDEFSHVHINKYRLKQESDKDDFYYFWYFEGNRFWGASIMSWETQQVEEMADEIILAFISKTTQCMLIEEFQRLKWHNSGRVLLQPGIK